VSGGTFRKGQCQRVNHRGKSGFAAKIRRGVAWAIEHGAAFDFLAHPSCLYVTDPKFQTIEMICQMVAKAGDRAELVDLNALAKRGAGRPAPNAS